MWVSENKFEVKWTKDEFTDEELQSLHSELTLLLSLAEAGRRKTDFLLSRLLIF
jgi:hypothetical protein